ncbi:hypothetical protein PG985_005265 [Apiospora marii]|uniref:Uncharacterized protein n=1 Tax=Apiospora marii TaxID=335849 RepID=A0ABR1SDA9_9PEZI
MDSTEDDPLDYLPDHRSPDRVIDPMVPGDSISQTEHADSALEAKRRDRQGSMFVPERTTTSPEPDQARIKQEPDTDGGLESRIEAEEPIDDRNLQEASTMAPHDENSEGDPPTSSNDNGESESFWAVETREKNPATSNHPKQGSDAQNIAEFNLLTEALEVWSSQKTKHEAQLKQNPGNLVDMKMLELCEAQIQETRDKLRDVETGMQTEDLNKEASSDAVSSDKAKPPPRRRGKAPKTIQEYHERENAKIEPKRNILFEKPSTDHPAKRRKTKKGPPKITQRFKDLVSNHSSDDSIDAPETQQSTSESHGLPDDTEKDEQTKIREEKKMKKDIGLLRAAERSFKGKCRAVDESKFPVTRWEIDGVKSRLTHHQLLGCQWMLGKEHGKDRGGINADDMGVGKTLQALVCIALNGPKSDDPKPTLIVVPASAVSQWMDEIPKHLDYDKNFTFTHFQAKKGENQNTLERMNIISEVERTYRTTKVQHGTDSPGDSGEEVGSQSDKHSGVLFRMKFFRVILDEAHSIKNRNSGTFTACRALDAKHRWALTATPLQNKVEEIWPYLAFLQVPWLPSRQDLKQRLNNLEDPDNDKWLTTMLDAIMLQRKQSCEIAGQKAWDAKGKHTLHIWIDQTEEERVIYRYIDMRFRQIALQLQDQMKQEGKSGNVNLLLTLLMYLRQATAHLFLLESAMKSKMCGEDIRNLQEKVKGLEKTPLLQQLERYHNEGPGRQLNTDALLGMMLAEKNDPICHLCGFQLTDPRQNKGEDQAKSDQPSAKDMAVLAKYGLTPEKAASYNLLEQKRKRRNDLRHCTKRGKDDKKLGNDYLDVQPRAKADDDMFLNALDNNYPEPLTTSAKTTKAISIVLEWQEEAPDDKIIIFTQFVQLGQILGRMLQAKGIHFLYFFGELSKKMKDAAIAKFNKAKGIKVMIVSLKCGGTALNLQCANRVIMVDPWWNESIENQAVGRVFRMGQTKDTYIRHIMVNDTVDRRIFDMQISKREDIGHAMNCQDYLRMLGSAAEDEDDNPTIVADTDT